MNNTSKYDIPEKMVIFQKLKNRYFFFENLIYND